MPRYHVVLTWMVEADNSGEAATIATKIEDTAKGGRAAVHLTTEIELLPPREGPTYDSPGA